MTGDRESFVRAICEVPGDDLPRLVYADWLDEHGGPAPCRECEGRGVVKDWGAYGYGYSQSWDRCDRCHGTGTVDNGDRERAEFIRVQCESARVAAAGTRLVDYGRGLVGLPPLPPAWAGARE